MRAVNDVDELVSNISCQADFDYYMKNESNFKTICFDIAKNCLVDINNQLSKLVETLKDDNSVCYCRCKIDLNIDENLKEYLELDNVICCSHTKYYISNLLKNWIEDDMKMNDIVSSVLNFDNTMYVVLATDCKYIKRFDAISFLLRVNFNKLLRKLRLR